MVFEKVDKIYLKNLGVDFLLVWIMLILFPGTLVLLTLVGSSVGTGHYEQLRLVVSITGINGVISLLVAILLAKKSQEKIKLVLTSIIGGFLFLDLLLFFI